MSSATDIGTICTNLQESITEIMGAAAPVYKRTKTGALDALISDYNRQNSMWSGVDQGFGKRRGKEFTYMQRRIESDVTETLGTCDSTGEAMAYESTTFDICDLSNIKFKIDMDYASKLCEGVRTFKDNAFKAQLEAMQRAINAKVLTKLQTGFGINQATGTAAAVTIDLIDQTNKGAINPDELTDWLSQLTNSNQFGMDPIVIAQGDFWKFNKLQKIGCCNDYGQDLSQLGDMISGAGYAYFNDQMIDSNIAANHAIVMEPGAAHFDRFYRYASTVQGAASVLDGTGAFAAWELSDGTARGVFVDPYSGVPYDFRITRDCDDYYFEIFLHFDVWTPPTDLYKAGDHMSGSTGILHYIFT